MDEARQELHRIINDREMRDAIILIFANKQDLPDGWWVVGVGWGTQVVGVGCRSVLGGEVGGCEGGL